MVTLPDDVAEGVGVGVGVDDIAVGVGVGVGVAVGAGVEVVPPPPQAASGNISNAISKDRRSLFMTPLFIRLRRATN